MLTLNAITGEMGRQEVWLRAVRIYSCIGSLSLRPREESWAPGQNEVPSAKERSPIGETTRICTTPARHSRLWV